VEHITIDSNTEVWAHFAHPRRANKFDDRTILNSVVRLIRKTEKGGTIHAAIYGLAHKPIFDAIEYAVNRRNVTVKVVQDGNNEFDSRLDTLSNNLRRLIGKSNHRFCGVRTENGNHGCITRHPTGKMHTKMFTFSGTSDPEGKFHRNVVWYGSANMTLGSGSKMFNNAITIYGAHNLHKSTNEYFVDLFANAHDTSNYYNDTMPDPIKGIWQGADGKVRVYASPEHDSDLVLAQLNNIKEDLGPCQIHVIQAQIRKGRRELVNRLVELKDGGCDVRVVAGRDSHRSMLKILRDAGIPVRSSKVHDKVILVDAQFHDPADANKASRKRLVFTGSHNWTRPANYENDEILVRVESGELYNAYRRHFRHAFRSKL
jgi:phosphatidylserine/phosphatidylglycerophosphate/cardiolipin synthase-like enzyme